MMIQEQAERRERAAVPADVLGAAEPHYMGGEELCQVVAHDLRNPLGCIEGYAALLQDPGLSQELREAYQKRILSCARWSLQIVDDLTDTAAMARGRLGLERAQEALGDILKEAVETFAARFKERGVELVLEAGASSRTVGVDRKRVLQILMNLLANALKYADAGRGSVRVALHDLGREAVVEVTDNGPGIAPEAQERIFDKFFRCGPAFRGSLGLGLHIARGIVEAHGGRIWARSAPGEGTSFFFSLPAFDPEAAYAGFKAGRGTHTPLPRPRS